jgi:endonuclease YncB( thermonuclease family)
MAKPVDAQKNSVKRAVKRRFAQPVRIGLVVLATLSATGPAAARAQPRQSPEPVASGTVRAVIDGDTLALESGVEVRLVGIQAPKLPLGRRGMATWPMASEAKQALSDLALGRTLSLSYGGRKIDRHGRLLAHLATADGSWIQGELLQRGLARVYTFADNRARAAEMLALERTARDARRGIWGNPFYRVLDPEEADRFTGTFQLVEGTVLKAAVVRGRAYLNFGPNWRTDFTVTMSRQALRRHWPRDEAAAAYEGRRVRVRGWLRSYNGPLIEATHPEQIEVLP